MCYVVVLEDLQIGGPTGKVYVGFIGQQLKKTTSPNTADQYAYLSQRENFKLVLSSLFGPYEKV